VLHYSAVLCGTNLESL